MKNETVKIGDLGISRMVETNQGYMKTNIGTPYYMAPEVSMRGKYDKSTDIYSLGCTIFELMLLKKPFTAKEAGILAV